MWCQALEALPAFLRREKSFFFQVDMPLYPKKSHLAENTLEPTPRMLVSSPENEHALPTCSRLLTHLGVLTNSESH